MLGIIYTLFALLLGTALFVAATGLAGTVISLRSGALGVSDAVTGVIMASYFAGFVAGTYLGPGIISRTGHIRAFSAFAATSCATVLLHPILSSPTAWSVLRFLTGLGVVGMYMVVESWLNEKTVNERRGATFAAYQTTALASLAAGQYFLLIDPASLTTPFLLSGALFALSLVPLAVTRVTEPPPVRPAKLDLGYLWSVSPLGVLGVFIAAIAGGVFLAWAPCLPNIKG